MIKIEDQYCN